MTGIKAAEIVIVDQSGKELATHKIPYGARVHVDEGAILFEQPCDPFWLIEHALFGLCEVASSLAVAGWRRARGCTLPVRGGP